MGTITWIDRNGNEMVPQYEDKMADDGNYDTFTWKYKGAFNEKTVDFPEKDKTSDGTLETAGLRRTVRKRRYDGSGRAGPSL